MIELIEEGKNLKDDHDKTNGETVFDLAITLNHDKEWMHQYSG